MSALHGLPARFLAACFLPALALALLLTGALPASSWAQAGPEARRLSVSGSGEVSARPDMAILSIGATARGASAGAALAEVNLIVQKMLAQAETLGIAGRDLMTRNLSVNPIFDNRREPGERPVPTAYQASNQLDIRIRDVAGAGTVIDAMSGAGANEMNGLQFAIAEPEALQDEARRLAVADARRRAEIYAEAAGVSLGEVLELEEQGGAPIRPMMKMMAAEATTPVAAGELSIGAQVRVTYALK